MDEKCKFKELDIRYLDDLIQMMADFNLHFDYPFNPLKRRETVLDFVKNERQGKIYLASINGQSVGYALLVWGFSFYHEGRDAIIDEIYLKVAFRNQGIGHKFISFLEEEAQKNGAKTLHLEVEYENRSAKRL